MLSVHPRLHDMQRRISQPFPGLALLIQSGSASKARPSPIISAFPLSKIPSAISGSIIRPTALTGMLTAAFTIPVISTKKPKGCTPIGGMVSAKLPVWLACATCSISTPASSSHFANCGASIKSMPPFPRSGVTTGNLNSIILLGTASFKALTNNSAKRVLFSKEPPNLSVRKFIFVLHNAPTNRSP